MTVQILQGDCREVLKTLPAESVDCVVTSPPYWRQRDYGVAGQIGLEQTPEEYVGKIVEIFREVRRVLRIDGTCWINIGDKWASGGNGGGGKWMVERGHAWDHAKGAKGWRKPPVGYKDKDLVGVPFMLAFAMRDDGWFWRQCNVWAKPNGMPESVSDRSTISHEYVLHFSKANDYFYNEEEARTPPAPSTETRLAQNVEEQAGSDRANGGGKTNGPMKAVSRKTDKQRGHTRRHAGFNDRWDAMDRSEQLATGANLRSVWWIAPAQYRDGHYAVMPDRLAEICIAAGTQAGGTILDPFGGAGTTGLVADRLRRNAILIELNPEYTAMAATRVKDDGGMFSCVESSTYSGANDAPETPRNSGDASQHGSMGAGARTPGVPSTTSAAPVHQRTRRASSRSGDGTGGTQGEAGGVEREATSPPRASQEQAPRENSGNRAPAASGEFIPLSLIRDERLRAQEQARQAAA